ncbi:hypothetical protein Mycsm_06130 [Mycobacterium sp. JS623]|uniref:helix-turn-helix domain-containing protein n=1 Tax=Mycobacterium sp. JS623 TaxID=212767 RepID=UPI0002A5B627|nr:hypothetical protein Mycsm_06130 [Mycobacterium sp. JS623]
MAIQDLTDTELSRLFVDTGIDLSTLPAIATSRELAPVMATTEAALAQDRYRRGGIPYVKFGRRVRYLRADVARYLAANRSDNPPGAASRSK